MDYLDDQALCKCNNILNAMGREAGPALPNLVP